MLIWHPPSNEVTLLWFISQQDWKLSRQEGLDSYQLLFHYPWAEESIFCSKPEHSNNKSKTQRTPNQMAVLSWLSKQSRRTWLRLLKTWHSSSNRLDFLTDLEFHKQILELSSLMITKTCLEGRKGTSQWLGTTPWTLTTINSSLWTPLKSSAQHFNLLFKIQEKAWFKKKILLKACCNMETKAQLFKWKMAWSVKTLKNMIALEDKIRLDGARSQN
jgi:hypothetical protein